MTDQNFRKLFVSLSALGIIIFLLLVSNIVFDVKLLASNLWIGVTIIYFTIVFYYTLSLPGKIITLFVSTFAFSTFLFLAFSWPISTSLLISFLPTIIIFGLFTLL